MRKTFTIQIRRLLVLTTIATCIVIPITAAQGGPSNKIELSSEERQWLEEHKGNIRYAPSPNYPPIGFVENGKYKGITADYLRRIEKQLNISFKMVYSKTWNEVMEKARSGKVDMVGNIQNTDTRREFLRFTSPYIRIPNLIIVRKDFEGTLSPSQMDGMRVAIVKSYSSLEYVKAKYPGMIVVPVRDNPAGLQMISFGRADAMITDLEVVSYFIERLGITNLKVAGSIDYVWDLCFASRKDWPIFNRILEKVMAQIGKKERRAIYHKWVRLESDLVFFTKRIWYVILTSAGVILAITLIIVIWNRTLKTETTKQEQIKEKLRKSEEHLRTIFENAPIGIDVVDKEGRPLYVNPALQKMIGYSEDELRSMPFTDFTHPDDVDESLRLVQSLLDGKNDRFEMEKRYYRKDGGLVWAHTTVSIVRDANGEFQHFIAMVKDITERKRDEDALRKSETQLRALAAQLSDMEIEARNKLAMKLHDHVGQNLSALNINLNIIKNRWPKEIQKKILDRLNDSLRLLEKTTRQVRNIISETRPDLLDHYGFLGALTSYGEEFSRRFEIDVQIKAEERITRFPLKTETMLFHIAKEAMVNVSKHARASCITISQELSDGRFRVIIADNGRGFDPDLTSKTDEQTRWGLLIMKERARAIGARFMIDSAPGKGTKIIVELKK